MSSLDVKEVEKPKSPKAALRPVQTFDVGGNEGEDHTEDFANPLTGVAEL